MCAQVGDQFPGNLAGIAEALISSSGLQPDVDLEEVGVIEKVGDGIATAIGMRGVMAGELVELPGGG